MHQFRNVTFWALGLLALIVGGFWVTYFSTLFAGLDFAHHFHAVVMLLWVGLLIVQPWLIRTRRRDLHRRLGRLGFAIAILVIVSGFNVAVFGLGDGVDVPGARGFYFGVFLTLNFTLMSALAFATRKTPALHARYMIATGLVFVIPAFGRLYFLLLVPLGLPPLPTMVMQALPALLAALLVAWDYRHGRIRAPFLVALASWLVHLAVRSQINDWPWWVDFANWVARIA